MGIVPRTKSFSPTVFRGRLLLDLEMIRINSLLNPLKKNTETGFSNRSLPGKSYLFVIYFVFSFKPHWGS